LPIGENLRVLPHVLDIPLLPFMAKKSKVPILTVPMTRMIARTFQLAGLATS
jgi:hypothetical protein